jgi:DNA-directed RNA polymerase specialized sigma24 family protein
MNSPLSSYDPTSDLDTAKALTEMMREHQQAVASIGVQRRGIIRRLRLHSVPYKQIAEACSVTDQALFADLRKHPEMKEASDG